MFRLSRNCFVHNSFFTRMTSNPVASHWVVCFLVCICFVYFDVFAEKLGRTGELTLTTPVRAMPL